MTREDAAIIVGNIPIDKGDDCYTIAEYQQAKAMAIRELNQVGVLDKIRAEILAMMPPLGKWIYEEGHIEEQTACEVIADVLQIIDKHTAESEE